MLLFQNKSIHIIDKISILCKMAVQNAEHIIISLTHTKQNRKGVRSLVILQFEA